MSRSLTIKLALMATIIVCGLLISSAPAAAQCAMCKTALTNSPETAKLAENFNKAVFVLLIPPVLLFCGIFVAAYKFRKAPGQSLAEESETKSPLRLLLDKLSARLRRRKQRGRETGGALT